MTGTTQDHPTDIFMQLRRMAIAAGVDPHDARVLTDRFMTALASEAQNGEVEVTCRDQDQPREALEKTLARKEANEG